ncbi:MAG: hypothetical protein HY922_08860 [Elusimicrobia bacterium]|nr:hypothetical protein [Elusimicrobiota bacterium]
MSPRIGAGLAAFLILLAAALWARKTYRITHPSFPLRTVETSTYRAAYPAHWEPIDTADPRIGEKEVLFMNHRGQEGEYEPYDRPRRHMTLRDEGTSYADLDALSAALLKDAEKPGPVESWRLANGVIAKTWIEHPAATDIPSVMRWLAFRGPDGRCYSAGFPVPRDWKARGRYEHIFKSILGSMEFKAAAK